MQHPQENTVDIVLHSYALLITFSDLLKHHLLPNVICSAIIHGKVQTPNTLNEYVNLTRDADDKLFLETAQLVVKDLMGTNGVLHVTDKVVIPDAGELSTIVNCCQPLKIKSLLLRM